MRGQERATGGEEVQSNKEPETVRIVKEVRPGIFVLEMPSLLEGIPEVFREAFTEMGEIDLLKLRLIIEDLLSKKRSQPGEF